MFMILVGRHVKGAPRREWEPAADAEGIELNSVDDGGALRGDERRGEKMTRRGRARGKERSAQYGTGPVTASNGLARLYNHTLVRTRV